MLTLIHRAGILSLCCWLRYSGNLFDPLPHSSDRLALPLYGLPRIESISRLSARRGRFRSPHVMHQPSASSMTSSSAHLGLRVFPLSFSRPYILPASLDPNSTSASHLKLEDLGALCSLSWLGTSNLRYLRALPTIALATRQPTCLRFCPLQPRKPLVAACTAIKNLSKITVPLYQNRQPTGNHESGDACHQNACLRAQLFSLCHPWFSLDILALRLPAVRVSTFVRFSTTFGTEQYTLFYALSSSPPSIANATALRSRGSCTVHGMHFSTPYCFSPLDFSSS